ARTLRRRARGRGGARGLAAARPAVRGLFITATDTGVGKTVLSAALLAAMADAGVFARAHKPVLTGLDETAGARGWPPDHELLTLEAARAGGLDVRAVVLTPWPARPSHLEQSNRATIARMGTVEVVCLGAVAQARRDELARAGATLPWRQWLGEAQPPARAGA